MSCSLMIYINQFYCLVIKSYNLAAKDLLNS